MTHTDDRGTIEDLKVGKDWSVTYISFKKGAVRGNHYHKKTVQYDVVLSGKLLCFRDNAKFECEPGDCIHHLPKTKHAYKALADSKIMSICYGKRVGENYEEDTFRLKEKLC